MVVLAEEWGHHQPQRTALANIVAVAIALSTLLLCWGLVRLRGVAPTSAAAWRLVLDGVMTGAALWFVGWVLLSEPTHLLGAATPRACPAILAASASAAGAVGLAFVAALRTARPRRAVLLVGSATAVVALCGLGLAAGICQVGYGLTAASAAVLPIGLVAAVLAARHADGPGTADGELIRRGAGYAFIPIVAVALFAIYHLRVDGHMTVGGVTAWMVAGFAMVIRQYLTLLDASGYAGALAKREAHFRELAHTDPLTGLANRRGLHLALEAGRSGSACVLLSLDLDGFKHVNDTRGHDVGDAVLIDVGRRLRQNVRPGDVAARLGGDEFAVLMWTGLAEAGRAAERLRDVMTRPYLAGTGPLMLSASIGLAGCESADDIESLLRNADLALRYAKQRGKNRVELYDRNYDWRVRRRTTLEHELRGAIDRGELRLAFQPVVAIPSMRPVGAEALLRWRHPRLGEVRPDEFIPLAEDCGVIADLGAWVLRESCQQLSIWLGAGYDLWVSVNVSPRELHEPTYVTHVDQALRAHDVPPQRLVLEVTEHAVATDVDELARRLCALRSTGVRIALDDFGAGYSSLGQLRRLPIDLLKIDHSLVSVVEGIWPPGDSRAAPMIDVVAWLGHRLGLEVIAEGVSNEAEFGAVTKAGCRFGQGSLFGWGVPAEHFEAMLAAASPLHGPLVGRSLAPLGPGPAAFDPPLAAQFTPRPLTPLVPRPPAAGPEPASPVPWVATPAESRVATPVVPRAATPVVPRAATPVVPRAVTPAARRMGLRAVPSPPEDAVVDSGPDRRQA
ncbi:MAG TPA: EAL domain-containing protein [Micromonosporaceae bacterium]|nr:EAL domain-containing protein [Micromonosporaceae bacterium]